LQTIETTAIIETGAKIGAGTTIGKHCFIGRHAVIGSNNAIASCVVIDGHTTIGDHNVIGSHTVLGTAPQDIKTTSDKVGLSIGNNNNIGSHVFITAGTEHGGMTTNIGDSNQMRDGIHIGHDVQMGSHCILEEDAALGGHVITGDYVSFGKRAAVHQFVEIGSHSCLAEDAALTQDLPPYCYAEGNRAKIAQLHQAGLEASFSYEERKAIQKAYTELFSEASPKENAIDALEKETSQVLQPFYRFIADSKRGIPFKRKTNVN